MSLKERVFFYAMLYMDCYYCSS